jgi:hypothetical protein
MLRQEKSDREISMNPENNKRTRAARNVRLRTLMRLECRGGTAEQDA